MAKPNRKHKVTIRISPPMRMIIAAAQKKKAAGHHPRLGLNHWVTALRELFPVLPDHFAWDELRIMDIRLRLEAGDVGPALSPEHALAGACRLAEREGLPAVSAYELIRVVLDKAKLRPLRGAGEPAEAVEATLDLEETGDSSDARAPETPSPAPSSPPTAASPTPTLDRYGRDLTVEAAAGRLPRVVERDDEVALMIETLCRQAKRNLALVGAPGVGKRALVDCLASRVRSGDVPRALAGLRLVEVQLVTLVAGLANFDELSQRVAQLAMEARSRNIALFFDDIRLVMAAGIEGPGAAIAAQLKPDLVRGDVTCIVSGSEEDYRRIMDVDPSWEDWFQPVRVEELTPDRTLRVLESVAAHAFETRGIRVPSPVQKWIVDFSEGFMKSHRFPGKAVDLVQQSIAHAISEGSKKVSLVAARLIAERTIGVPTDIQSRLRNLSKLLSASGMLVSADQQRLEDRLSVTLRSLDLRPARPNATILLAGSAAAHGHSLAEALAEGIAGSPERVISIDLSTFVEPWDLRQILGASCKPGSRATQPFLRLADAPWSVVLFENIDACHAHVRATLTRVLQTGYFTDVTGRKIYVSDAVVVLTAPTAAIDEKGPLGFAASDESSGAVARVAATHALGQELGSMLDLIVAQVRTGSQPVASTRKRTLLDLTKRYRTRGLEIAWEKTVVDWLCSKPLEAETEAEWDEWADRTLSAALLPHLPPKRTSSLKRVIVKRDRDQIVVSAPMAGRKVHRDRSKGSARISPTTA